MTKGVYLFSTKLGNTIIFVLFSVFIIIPFASFTQNYKSTYQRQTDFYLTIQDLYFSPEKLELHKKSTNYPKDSILIYYQEIAEEHEGRQEVLNTAQNIYWLHEIGLLQQIIGKVNLSIETYQTALKLVNLEDNEKVYIQLKFELAEAYRHNGNKKKSNEIFDEVLELPSLQSNIDLRMGCLGSVAENCENLGENQRAMELCLDLYDYSISKDDFATASYNLIQMGRIAAHLESDTSYLEYFHMANSMAELAGDTGRIANNLVNTGIAYRKAGYALIAIRYLLEAEKHSKYESNYGRAYSLIHLSTTYFDLDSISKANIYAKKALKKAKEIDSYNLMFKANKRIAACYEKSGQYDSAKIYLNEALKLSWVFDSKNYKINLFKQLSDISIKLEDYALAVSYLDSSYANYARFVTEENKDKLAQLRVESDYYMHRTRITELVSKNKVEQEKTKWLIAIIVGVILVLVLTVYFSAVIQKRLKELRESYVNLVRKNIELDNLNSKLHDCEVRPNKRQKTETSKDDVLMMKRLRKLLYKDEVFANPDLSLKYLADELHTNTSYLSAAVNTHFHCNLRSLINRHRIDKARKMLVSVEFKHYSMEGIAFEVGFKSRSGFYQAFKAVTGLSPSLYIDNYKIAIAS